MTAALIPRDEAELVTMVRDAAGRRTPLAVEGSGTRRGLGRPMQTAATLSTAKLTGVTLYEPTELVLSARAGTPLSEVEALLAKRGQRLAFEPMDHRLIERSEQADRSAPSPPPTRPAPAASRPARPAIA